VTQPSKVQLTAPCGLDCFNCQLYEANITEELKQRMARLRHVEPEKISCRGCRIQGGYCLLVESCATLECIKKKNVAYCFECNEFPCLKLAPAREGAETFPHNFKLFNLCRMKAIGVERWAEEESRRIRELYYTGRFVPGSGPVERAT
jgi:hypothetical protein